MNELQCDILNTEQAMLKYDFNFYLQKDNIICGSGIEVFILLKNNIPIAWYLFTVEINDTGIREYSISDTGIYVLPGYRGKGLGNYLVERFVRYLDNRLGRGNYIFMSIIITRKGRSIGKFRDSLTGNPDEHKNYIIKELVPTY